MLSLKQKTKFDVVENGFALNLIIF